MLYTINPTLQIKSISFEEDSLIYDHYHKLEYNISVSELALLIDNHWPTTHENLFKIANEFIDGNQGEVEEAVNNLIDSNIIVIDTEQYVQAANYWIDNGWASSLFYHLSSQQMEHWDDVHHESNELEEIDNQIERIYSKEELNWIKNELIYSRDSKISHKLKKELIENNKSYDDVLKNRSSFKKFSDKPITFEEISHLFWASNQNNHKNRVTCYSELDRKPSLISSSKFTPLEIYVYIRKPDNSIKSGLYHFNSYTFSLDLIPSKGDFDINLISSCAGQRRVAQGSITILITMHLDRIMNRYRHSRAYRSHMVSVGEMAQNLLMNATYLDKSYFISPALLDEKTGPLLELPDSSRCLYSMAIG